MSNYRKEFYERIDHYWADMYGKEYSLFDVFLIDEKEKKLIKDAANKIGYLFFKINHLLRNVDDEILLQMGFPKETFPFLRLKLMQTETVISRLDMVKVKNSYKLLEINSDTPTFIKELFYINDLICKEFGVINPNEGQEERLRNVLRSAIKEAANIVNQSKPYIVFTSHEENDEDKYTVQYLQSLSGLPSEYIPLEKLQIIKGKGLYNDRGRRIDILYRQTFPIENLIHDKDSDTGEPIGLYLLELVREKKLAFINPPSAFLLQSKAIQAVIWGLHEKKNSYFNKQEHEWIKELFLPTYLEADIFLEQRLPFVKKPCFGREGDTVEIYNKDGSKIIEDKNKSYIDYLAVYQKYVELPTAFYYTEEGRRKGHIMVGCFLLNGYASSFGFRVGNHITDNLSYFLPVGITNDPLRFIK